MFPVHAHTGCMSLLEITRSDSCPVFKAGAHSECTACGASVSAEALIETASVRADKGDGDECGV